MATVLSDKELKKKYLKVFSQSPDNYYPTDFLKKEGFKRIKCSNCSKYFWSINYSDSVCGDSECRGKVSLYESNLNLPALTYIDVWNLFKKSLSRYNYKPINRYPVVAKWNPTTDFTIASIAAFQPFVVSGEVEPPHRKLIIPQFCLRFGDIDNVGITGSHCTGFVMIGQHQFVKPSEWDQTLAFKAMYEFLLNDVKLPKSELILHEDSWAGGGNLGPCMEFFSNGIELFNQVYMLYYQNPDGEVIDLDLKVLDMGMGMERISWFTQKTLTMYDSFMPNVINFLKEKTGVVFDEDLYRKFSPYSTLLNIDEVDDINKAWENIAEKLDLSVDYLKSSIGPMTALYSIAEHTRSLLFALTDGALPSNVGGGYNLRVILRRALSFMKQYGWDNFTLFDLCKLHSKELYEIFPSLSKNLDDIKIILEKELEKFENNLVRSKALIKKVLSKGVDVNKLIELYDSHGISPDDILYQAKKLNLDISNLTVPDNFYTLVAEKHSLSENKTKTKKSFIIPINNDLPVTLPLYFKDYLLTEFDAFVIDILDCDDKDYKYVILDETAFYPTSGGQEHDLGTIDNCDVLDVFKQGKYIIHKVKRPSFKVTDKVHCSIDEERRLQLTQHHTATHIVNGACRQILGNHVWQAGASKSVKKARLDITHFDVLSDDDISKIEDLANEIISLNLPVHNTFLKRNIAEQSYGFRIYQGGAVPGDNLRIVDINCFDVEACGGTHLNFTGEAVLIKIIKSSKLQDGIIRLEFVAGKAAEDYVQELDDIIFTLEKLLHCSKNQLPGRCSELFQKWKKIKKLKKKNQEIPSELLELTSTEQFLGDVIQECADRLKTQKPHLISTVKKFLKDFS